MLQRETKLWMFPEQYLHFIKIALIKKKPFYSIFHKHELIRTNFCYGSIIDSSLFSDIATLSCLLQCSPILSCCVHFMDTLWCSFRFVRQTSTPHNRIIHKLQETFTNFPGSLKQDSTIIVLYILWSCLSSFTQHFTRYFEQQVQLTCHQIIWSVRHGSHGKTNFFFWKLLIHSKSLLIQKTNQA